MVIKHSMRRYCLLHPLYVCATSKTMSFRMSLRGIHLSKETVCRMGSVCLLLGGGVARDAKGRRKVGQTSHVDGPRD